MTARNASRRLGIEDTPPAPHWGYAPQGAPPDTRYINGRRVKAAGMVDDHGMYYILPKSRAASLASSLITAIAIGVLIACALLFLPSFLAPPTTTTNVYQLGTADVPPRPTQEPPSGEGGGAPAGVPLFNAPNPTPYDNRAYNATAQAIQAAAEPTPAPEEDRWADGEFWTEAEKAAFAATDVAAAKAKTDEFINNPPTPAPELITEMEQKCADAALVARSPLLQLWCGPLEGD